MKIDHDRYRRRVYFSLDAAERAVTAARAKGHAARVIVCELQPKSSGDAQ